MPNDTHLIIPGYTGSGLDHWQTWFETNLPNARRVMQDWEKPVLSKWADNIRAALASLDGKAWLIAHSYACLAAVVAADDHEEKVAGMMLVAPADPLLFNPEGVLPEKTANVQASLYPFLPTNRLSYPTLMIASTDDPWMPIQDAKSLAECWGSDFIRLSHAGHINVAAGFSAWADGLKMLEEFKKKYDF